ncbi:unnamed protein product [Pleuronectes platessa]|uniref:Uncharacterized protein n=1 Tax=Pleuronectes platessa TaxID=8262 RepID=A0A9N7Z402_PLEPL|nr:unnamed protein product [Pleuronectes platessa]
MAYGKPGPTECAPVSIIALPLSNTRARDHTLNTGTLSVSQVLQLTTSEPNRPLPEHNSTGSPFVCCEFSIVPHCCCRCTVWCLLTGLISDTAGEPSMTHHTLKSRKPGSAAGGGEGRGATVTLMAISNKQETDREEEDTEINGRVGMQCVEECGTRKVKTVSSNGIRGGGMTEESRRVPFSISGARERKKRSGQEVEEDRQE